MNKPYISDTTQFLRKFLKRNPKVKKEQIKARAAWWDKPQDIKENEKQNKYKIPKKPYEYY